MRVMKGLIKTVITRMVKNVNNKVRTHMLLLVEGLRMFNNKYKHLGKSCQWVIDNSPSAFSRKGDATTLQIGARLLMGYK